MILRGWFPALRESKAPVVVNVGSMISSRIDFGTFAVLPDHRALGLQAAQLIADIAEDGFKIAEPRFEYPLSVETVLNLKFARRKIKLEEGRIATVDRVIE